METKSIKILFGIVLLCSLNDLLADVVFDGSSGASGNLQGPVFNITEELGTVSGTNLLHSFLSFNIAVGETANFTHTTAAINNILARVTGQTETVIDGNLNADTNLWLLNPNGVLVGAEASINVAGSFMFNKEGNNGDDPIALILDDGSTLTVDTDLNTLNIANPLDFGFVSDVSNPRIVVDDSLGGISSVIVGVDNSGITEFLLDGDDPAIAQTIGSNIFFSFAKFNLFSDERAVFSSLSSSPLAHIVARVTGGVKSILNGEITTQGEALSDASFWFINPAGIIAGQGLAIDISGSIGLGAADFVSFDDDTRFQGNSQTPSTLSTGVPTGFGFMGSTGTLSLTGSSIIASPISDITLAGSSLELRNTQVGNFGADGEVTGNISLIGDNQQILSSVIVTANPVGAGGGSINIIGDTLLLDGGSSILTSTTGDTAGGNIFISADELTLQGSFGIDPASGVDFVSTINTSASSGMGDGGSLTINVSNLNLLDNVTISSNTFSGGQAGSILVNANDVLLQGPTASVTSSGSFSGTTGGAGNIVINATNSIIIENTSINPQAVSGPGFSTISSNCIDICNLGGNLTLNTQLFQSAGGTFTAFTFGDLPGGDITLDANVIEASNSFFSVGSVGSGQSGSLALLAEQILLDDNTFLSSSGFGGAILLLADDIQLTRATDIRVIASGPAGTSGADILLFGGDVLIDGGSSLSAPTSGDTSGGNILVVADTLTLQGDSGIDPTTGSVRGSNIAADTLSGAGNGGSIAILVDQLNVFDSSSISSSTSTGANAGNIDIEAIDVLLRGPDAAITAGSSSALNSPGTGRPGTITINASNSIIVENTVTEIGDNRTPSISSLIIDCVTNCGNQGSINLNTQTFISRGATFAVSTFGNAPGGDFILNANTIVATNSVFNAESFGTGRGGSILINANQMLLDGTSSLTTTSTFNEQAGRAGLGDAGNILLNISGELRLSSAPEFSGEQDLAVSISSRSLSPNTDAGNAGTIVINAGSLVLDGAQILATTAGGSPDSTSADILLNIVNSMDISRGGRVQADTFGAAPGGRISINADSLIMDGMGTALSSNTGGSGNGGSVTVNANAISLANGAHIETTATSDGDSGLIDLIVMDGLTLVSAENEIENQSAIISQSSRSQGGDISLNVGGELSLINSSIVASVDQASGNGGDVAIVSNSLFMQQSLILAQAQQGNGGAITINRQASNNGLFIIGSQSAINADSLQGVSGSVNVESPDTDANAIIQPQDGSIVNAPVLLDGFCSPRNIGEQSTFVVQNRGGIATSPDAYYTSSISGGEKNLVASLTSAPAFTNSFGIVDITCAYGW